MASIERRGDRWRVRWRDPAGRNRSKTFDRKHDAQRWVVKVSHDMLAGTYIDPAGGRLTFREHAEKWRLERMHRPSTAIQVEQHFRNHVYPVLGDMPLAKITPGDVQALVSGLVRGERTEDGDGWVKRPLAPATARTVYAYVRGAMAAAVRYRLLPATPCQGIDLPEKRDRTLELLAVDQVARVCDAMHDRYRAMVVLGAGAGLRVGEMRGLRVDRVDFLRRSVKVDAQLARRSRVLSEPKTPSSVRTIPVGSTVTDALAEHLARFGPGPDGLVFSSRAGSPVSSSTMQAMWQEAADIANLPQWATWHDLRHFYASLLIRQGLDVKIVQARLGHRSATTTIDLYGHLWPDDEDRSRDAVDLVLGEALYPSRTQVDDGTRPDLRRRSG